MSNCFEISDGHVYCHNCHNQIPAFEQYTWYDVGQLGENMCKTCVDGIKNLVRNNNHE